MENRNLRVFARNYFCTQLDVVRLPQVLSICPVTKGTGVAGRNSASGSADVSRLLIFRRAVPEVVASIDGGAFL